MWKSCIFNFTFFVFCWIAVWNHIEASKSFFVQLFFSSCGTDNKKRNCLIEENLARTFITNIVWARGKMLFTVFYVENFQWHSSFGNSWNKNWTSCLTYLNISASAHLKKLSDHFFVKLSRIAIAMHMFVSDSNWNSYHFRLLDQFIFVDRDTKYFVQSVPADWVSWICSYKYKYKYTNTHTQIQIQYASPLP